MGVEQESNRAGVRVVVVYGRLTGHFGGRLCHGRGARVKLERKSRRRKSGSGAYGRLTGHFVPQRAGHTRKQAPEVEKCGTKADPRHRLSHACGRSHSQWAP